MIQLVGKANNLLISLLGLAWFISNYVDQQEINE